VGLVYIALAWEDSVRIKRFVFPGDRSSIRQRSVVAALDLLRRYSR
jgi:nicotinamide mononucleotide (NMN) deamidase PncC